MTRNELTLYAWDLPDHDPVITKEIYSQINFMWFQEFELGISNAAKEHINKHKIPVRVVTCASNVEQVIATIVTERMIDNKIERSIDPDLMKSAEAWPGYWFLWSHHSMLDNRNNFYRDITFNKYKFNFRIPYLTYNGRSRTHRTKLINQLVKNNYIEEGVVVYHQLFGNAEPEDLDVYDGTAITGNLNDNFSVGRSPYVFNEQFLQSFLHIPTESSIYEHLISEKTAIPILCKQPFLTLGCVNYHKKLKEMGFKLYDEIFDYSFDSEHDLDLRIEKLMKNVKMVVNNRSKLNAYYSLIKNKIEHNRNLAIDMFTYRENYPRLVLDRFDGVIPPSQFPAWESKLMILKKYTNGEYDDINSDIVYTDLWYNFDFEKLVTEIKTKKPKKIFFAGENEWSPWFTDEFLQEVNEHNIEVTYICGAFESDYTNARLDQLKNVVRVYWPTFWFNHAYNTLRTKVDIERNEVNKNFKYPFISMNNRPHLHRCHFIDEVAKQQMLDKGIVTWNDVYGEPHDYTFEYFDGKRRSLNDNFSKEKDSFIIPKEWHESFFHCIVECSYETVMISEKTLNAILLKKPFFCLSAPGFHAALKSLGFQLYEEFIDYSFDAEPDLKKRTELFVANLQGLTKIKNLKEAYELIHKKIDYNYKRYLEIKDDINLFPEVVRNIIKDIPATQKVGLAPHQRKYIALISRA